MEVTVSKQLDYTAEIVRKKLSIIYKDNIYLKLATIRKTKDEKIEKLLSEIDLFHSLIELCIMMENPRRAVHYLCLLNECINRFIILIEYVDLKLY